MTLTGPWLSAPTMSGRAQGWKPSRPRTIRPRFEQLGIGSRGTAAQRRGGVGEGTDLPNGYKTTRPQGGAITEWYKGKTPLPIWRRISPEICRHLIMPNATRQKNAAELVLTQRAKLEQ